MSVKIARKVNDQEFSKSKLLFLRKSNTSSFDPIYEYNVIDYLLASYLSREEEVLSILQAIAQFLKKLNNKIKKV